MWGKGCGDNVNPEDIPRPWGEDDMVEGNPMGAEDLNGGRATKRKADYDLDEEKLRGDAQPLEDAEMQTFDDEKEAARGILRNTSS